MKPYYDRIVATVSVIAGLVAVLYWLLPDLPLALRIIFGLPMVFGIFVVTVLPERKGRIWPKNQPISRGWLRFQRYVLAFSVEVMLIYSVSVYSFFFPVPSYFQYRTNNQSAIIALYVGVWIALLAMIRHHVRSLPPKP
jgi:hypothetical protein